MTFKERLLKYLRAKSLIIARYTCISYMSDADYREIGEKWTEERCEYVVGSIEATIEVGNIKYDGNLCPWCVINCGDCSDCGYGQRHGFCEGELMNIYTLIIVTLQNSKGIEHIKEIPEIKELKI